MSALANWVASGRSAPILYLPLNDPTQPGKNLGTGGDFNLTGVVARSGRGPNQYNVPVSQMVNTSQYLSNSGGLTGTVSKLMACVSFRPTQTGTNYIIGQGYWSNSVSTGYRGAINVWVDSANKLNIDGGNSVGIFVYGFVSTDPFIVPNRNYVLVISVDIVASRLQVYLNGQSLAGTTTWSGSYTTCYFASSTYVGSTYTSSGGSGAYRGFVGGVWITKNVSLDLSVATNLAKFVTGTGIDAKPVDLGANGELPTGTSPMVYLPMYGNNAGKNYGTGGDFTVKSGPYPGARGPNEFWGNKADFNGTTGYLRRAGGLSGISNTKTFSFCVWLDNDTLSGSDVVFQLWNAGNIRMSLLMSGSQFSLQARNAANTNILVAGSGTVFATGTRYCIQGSVDLANTANRSVYVNGTLDTMTWTIYTNDTIDYSSANEASIGATYVGSPSSYYDGRISEFYFTTQYIDFSQEANRLKFRDAFGNPVALQPQIEAGTLPNPAIYMRFDPNNKGKNSGTGGDFTVNGTITDGGQL